MKNVDLQQAAVLFAGKCAACHGEHLQGIIGPNLTDEYWIHGRGTRKDIVGIIRSGVLEKGMPSWESLLKPDEIISLAAYIISKQDSHPANPKAPQGEKVR
jgi:cytochrome c oxidase cbb3-type subunit 3